MMPYGWMTGWGVFWMVFSWALIALIVFLLVRAVSGSSSSGSPERADHRILAERFARGEISEQEYRERKKVLDETR